MRRRRHLLVAAAVAATLTVPVPAASAAAGAAAVMATLAGGPGSGPATSVGQTPSGVAIGARAGAAPLVYVAAANVVRVLDTGSGTETVVAGAGPAGFGGDGGPASSALLNGTPPPSTTGDNPEPGVAVDGAGNLFIADTYNNRVRRVDAASGVITTVAGTGPAGFGGDGGLASAAQLNQPTGVVVDASGNLFIADIYNNLVRRVDAVTGVITTVAGTATGGFGGDGGAATQALLSFPYSVALDRAGDLFVADSGNFRVRRVDAASGVITTVAGTGTNPTATNTGNGGPATQAAMHPVGVVADAVGDLFIADEGTSTVRKVDAKTQVITVAAGTSGVPGSVGDNGPATAAELNGPRAVAVDSSGNVFIGDTGNYRLRRVDAATAVITTAAGDGASDFGGDGGPALSAQIHRPGLSSYSMGGSPVVSDASGNVFIADSANNRVRKVDAAAHTMSTVAGTGAAPAQKGVVQGDGGPATMAVLNGPTAVAVDAAGNVFIADTGDRVVRKVDAKTQVITTYAGGGIGGAAGDGLPATAAGLGAPSGLALDAAGDLFIADISDCSIRRVDGASTVITTVAGNHACGFGGDGGAAKATMLNQPASVVVDGAGNVYIADTGNNRVRKVDAATGIISSVAGSGTAGYNGDGIAATAAALNGPGSLVLAPQVSVGAGGLIIADTLNNRIRRVDPATGLIATVAGTGTEGYTGESGSATGLALDSPGGVAFDPSGNLLVADTVNDRIRKVSAAAAAPADFDGDGLSEVSVFRPSSGAWMFNNGQATVFQGLSGDVPVPCDYAGTGKAQEAVFRPSSGGWFIAGQAPVYFGLSGDVPVPGDYTGAGHCTIAVFRPSSGAWFIQGQATVYFGLNGDVPVPGHYRGAAALDVAVFRPSSGAWFIQGQATVYFGLNGDIPVPGNYSGAATTDVAVYRPSVGGWYRNGAATTYLGLSGDVPVPGMYNTAGTSDVAVFRPSTGAWYIAAAAPVYLGVNGDIPLPLPAASRLAIPYP